MQPVLSDSSPTSGVVIHVKGLVQGVGFRPWVWRIANKLNIRGRVYNHDSDVMIECCGSASSVHDLIDHVRNNPPGIAHVTSIDVNSGHDFSTTESFIIDDSVKECRVDRHIASVALDLKPCDSCLQELFDPDNRRYRYPFISCAECGPRYSIMQSLPFDRQRTSMSAFALCDDCNAEYNNPQNRRFYAQTTSCHHCGPTLFYADANGRLCEGDPIELAQAALRRGEIIALKGVGGFQLIVDASNEMAVERLRSRKYRPHKPFALMVHDIEVANCYGELTDQAYKALTSFEAPIVLVKKNTVEAPLSKAVAPHLNRIGMMLPSSALHCLLLEGWNTPLVVTSGNPNGAPLCMDNESALAELSLIADGYLFHDREIEHRLDDSVVQCTQVNTVPLRLGRGFTPVCIALPPGFENTPSVLAMGADLKNAACLMGKSGLLLSPYNGDLQDARTSEASKQRLDDLLAFFDQVPSVIAVDSHPNYRSTAEGYYRAKMPAVWVQSVQHHHAHLAACLAENQWPLQGGPVLGLVLDGMGYGTSEDADEQNIIWGGELLLGGYDQCQRIARLKPVALPGGDLAARQPWRNALSQLHDAIGWPSVLSDYSDVSAVQRLVRFPVDAVLSMIETGVNSPLSSSCGRLFDAVAFVLGVCSSDELSYEGQGAMGVQRLAECYAGEEPSGYLFEIEKNSVPWNLNPAPMWRELLADLQQDESQEVIAYKFHIGLVSVLQSCIKLSAEIYHLNTIALSGGVFQNTLIANELCRRLDDEGYTVLTHRKVPPNDGGVAVGQAIIAAAKKIKLEVDA